jgi:hypothetical protein
MADDDSHTLKLAFFLATNRNMKVMTLTILGLDNQSIDDQLLIIR